jgi:hypothetical protein
MTSMTSMTSSQKMQYIRQRPRTNDQNYVAAYVRFWPAAAVRCGPAVRLLSEVNPTLGYQGLHRRP